MVKIRVTQIGLSFMQGTLPITAKNFRRIVVLTGAGISAESGIKTFRDQNGLWENHKIEDVATPQGFKKNKSLVYEFYNERRRQLLSPEVIPNPAHMALANFEKNFLGEFTLITQNVDNLHQRAGSQNCLPMHGELLKARCLTSCKIFDMPTDFDQETVCPCCQKKGELRPHIVWFGETPLFMGEIQEVVSKADLFVAIGTSGQVYPAAGLVQLAKKYANATTVEINLAPVSQNGIKDSFFDYQWTGKASQLVPELFIF